MTRSRSGSRAGVTLALLLLTALPACGGRSTPGGDRPVGPPFTLSGIARDGDAQRRASQHLVLEGLAQDDLGEPGRARELYRRASQVDAGNPYVYLALARHYQEFGEPRRVLGYVDQTYSLGASEASWSPQVETHLAGLRGAALRSLGREREARTLLQRAASEAPWIWDDGFLSARELR